MGQPRRYYGENHLHYLTASTYRRTRVFDSERFKRQFVSTLAELRGELGFRILGYVLMPEHFHLLLWPSERANPSQIMQKLKGRTARFILKDLRGNVRYAWCARMLAQFALPATVHGARDNLGGPRYLPPRQNYFPGTITYYRLQEPCHE